MPEAFVRFYGGLNDLLPPGSRGGRTLVHLFDVSPSVGSIAEGYGVPHTEVDLAVVNGEISDLSRRVQAGDRIALYPAFRSIDLGRADLRPLRFVLDIHLGRLAGWLRMLGFDALFPEDPADKNLARIAADDDRILLTRDRGLLMRREVRRGWWLRSTDPKRQLLEVAERYGLLPVAEPFTRCLECNALLRRVDKGSVIAPEGVLASHDEFRKCPICRRVFWKGSHYRRMTELIEFLRRYGKATS